eukprot:2678042-Rhodomonas_salina.3
MLTEGSVIETVLCRRLRLMSPSCHRTIPKVHSIFKLSVRYGCSWYRVPGCQRMVLGKHTQWYCRTCGVAVSKQNTTSKYQTWRSG